MIRPIVKIHGGKYYLKTFILQHFPTDYNIYCEPCCGAASVFLNTKSANEEIINDLDKGVTSIFKALRDEPTEFIGRLKRVKYTEATFNRAKNHSPEDYVEMAINEYILRRMSRGGLKQVFAWSERKRGGQPGDVNAWETMIKALPNIAERVKDVIILNEDCRQVIKAWDSEDVMVYLDPPYLPITRKANEVYDKEMTTEEHNSLLVTIRDARCKVMISGYESDLYTKYLGEWRKAKKEVPNHASQQKIKEKRVETIWMNYS